MCILSVGIMNISMSMLVVFESKEFVEKAYIHFSYNIFSIRMTIINLGNYIGRAIMFVQFRDQKYVTLSTALPSFFLESNSSYE